MWETKFTLILLVAKKIIKNIDKKLFYLNKI